MPKKNKTKKVDTHYAIELDTEQLNLVMDACELYVRLMCGQWNELLWQCQRYKKDIDPASLENAENLLFLSRAQMFKELGSNIGLSHGVGYNESIDRLWEIYEVIRHCISWTENPEGGWGVAFDNPLPLTGKPFAKCTAIKENKKENKKENNKENNTK